MAQDERCGQEIDHCCVWLHCELEPGHNGDHEAYSFGTFTRVLSERDATDTCEPEHRRAPHGGGREHGE